MTDLEKRLRERLIEALGLAHEPWYDDQDFEYGWGDILTAARIAAEIEREECARLCAYDDGVMPVWDTGNNIARLIRMRGDK